MPKRVFSFFFNENKVDGAFIFLPILMKLSFMKCANKSLYACNFYFKFNFDMFLFFRFLMKFPVCTFQSDLMYYSYCLKNMRRPKGAKIQNIEFLCQV